MHPTGRGRSFRPFYADGYGKPSRRRDLRFADEVRRVAADLLAVEDVHQTQLLNC